MTNFKKIFGWTFFAMYMALWAIAVVGYFWKKKFDVMILLGIFTLPSSLIVSGLSHVATSTLNISNDTGVIMDFFGFLTFGSIEYIAIGYVVGAIVEKVLRR